MPFGLGFFAVAGAGAGAAGDYELIETIVLSSDATSVVFSNLGNYANTYKHLQIRGLASASTNTWIRFNGDGTASYNDHVLRGTGTSVQSTNLGTGSEIPVDFRDYDAGPANRFGAGIIDILDFSNTSKFKTTRALAGCVDPDIFPRINLHGGLWRNTAAITSITISAGTNLLPKSRFSLYGIKG